jgi:cell division protein FtsL
MDQLQAPKGKTPAILIVLIIVLMSAIGVMTVMYFNLKVDAEEKEAILVEEKARLKTELQELYVEYDSLQTDNDSMNIMLEAEQQKIQKLLAIRASNAETIRLYKKELGTLRSIMRSYVVQINSLNQKNQMLAAENIKVRTQLRNVEKNKQELEKEKENLTSEVNKAKVLQAKNIIAYTLNERSKEKSKASKVVKIRVCFTLRENPIVTAGEKTVYIRIINPHGTVMVNDPSFLVEYKSQQIAYSESRVIEYQNADIDGCIFWHKNEALFPGMYTVELYAEGNMIGSSNFELDK